MLKARAYTYIVPAESKQEPMIDLGKIVRGWLSTPGAIVDPKLAQMYGSTAPPYPKGDVAGACVCGSWPGGKCLRCQWRAG